MKGRTPRRRILRSRWVTAMMKRRPPL